MPGEPPERPSTRPAKDDQRPGRSLDWWIDVAAKFAMPSVLGVFTIVATWQASTIQNKLSSATLLSQREQAESQLRASMFMGETIGDQKDLLQSPDGTRRLQIGVAHQGPDWEDGRFKVTIEAFTDTSTMPDFSTKIAPLTLSWADLPLTDNTLFPDGNRFALVVYKVYPDEPLKYAILKLIWFPKEYFTPRERPLDYGEFLKLVGKKVK